MNQAALQVYQIIRQQGSQQDVIDRMQSREELYEILNYHAYEDQLDHLQDREQ